MIENGSHQPAAKGETNNPLTGRVTMKRALQIAESDGRGAISLSMRDWKQAEEEMSREADQATDCSLKGDHIISVQ